MSARLFRPGEPLPAAAVNYFLLLSHETQGICSLKLNGVKFSLHIALKSGRVVNVDVDLSNQSGSIEEQPHILSRQCECVLNAGTRTVKLHVDWRDGVKDAFSFCVDSAGDITNGAIVSLKCCFASSHGLRSDLREIMIDVRHLLRVEGLKNCLGVRTSALGVADVLRDASAPPAALWYALRVLVLNVADARDDRMAQERAAGLRWRRRATNRCLRHAIGLLHDTIWSLHDKSGAWMPYSYVLCRRARDRRYDCWIHDGKVAERQPKQDCACKFMRVVLP